MGSASSKLHSQSRLWAWWTDSSRERPRRGSLRNRGVPRATCRRCGGRTVQVRGGVAQAATMAAAIAEWMSSQGDDTACWHSHALRCYGYRTPRLGTARAADGGHHRNWMSLSGMIRGVGVPHALWYFSYRTPRQGTAQAVQTGYLPRMVAYPAPRAAASAVRTYSPIGRFSGRDRLEPGLGRMVYVLRYPCPRLFGPPTK